MAMDNDLVPFATPVMVRVARLFDEWRKADWRKRTLKKVETMSRVVGERLFPGQKTCIRESRLSRLLAWRNLHGHKRGKARMPQPHELPILAAIMEVTIEELTGLVNASIVIKPDLPTDTRIQDMFQNLLSGHLRTAVELLGWAEFLPCSLETSEFMRAHHQSLFSPLYEGDPNGLKNVLGEYNELGDKQRNRLQSAGIDRPWRFTHLMFRSDFLKIVQPPASAQQYALCTKDARTGCLDSLSNLIARPSCKIQLGLVSAKDVPILKRRLHDFDSVIVIIGRDGKGIFTWKRNHVGELWLSEKPEEIEREFALLQQLRASASLCTTSDLERAKKRLATWN